MEDCEAVDPEFQATDVTPAGRNSPGFEKITPVPLPVAMRGEFGPEASEGASWRFVDSWPELSILLPVAIIPPRAAAAKIATNMGAFMSVVG